MKPEEYFALPHGTKAYHIVYNISNGCKVISNIYRTRSGAMKFYNKVKVNGKPELYERIRGENDAGVKIK